MRGDSSAGSTAHGQKSLQFESTSSLSLWELRGREEGFESGESRVSRIAREKTSLRLFRAEKTGFKSESDSEGGAGERSGGLEGPNLLIAALNLLAGEALSPSEPASSPAFLVRASSGVRENRNMCFEEIRRINGTV